MAGMFHVGDLVWYVLPSAPGRPRPIFASAVVVGKIRTRRGPLVGVRTVLGRRPRYVAPWSLTADNPPADVDVLWSDMEADALAASRGRNVV